MTAPTFADLWNRLIWAYDAERAAIVRHGHSDLRSDQAMIVEARIRRISVEHAISEHLERKSDDS